MIPFWRAYFSNGFVETTNQERFQKNGSSTSNKAFIQLRGEPCGGVWGVPIDVDASSRAIWVVCSKEPLGRFEAMQMVVSFSLSQWPTWMSPEVTKWLVNGL